MVWWMVVIIKYLVTGCFWQLVRNNYTCFACISASATHTLSVNMILSSIWLSNSCMIQVRSSFRNQARDLWRPFKANWRNFQNESGVNVVFSYVHRLTFFVVLKLSYEYILNIVPILDHLVKFTHSPLCLYQGP